MGNLINHISYDKKIQQLEKLITQLQTENSQLKSVIDNLPGDIYWKNREGVWAGVNNTGAETLRRMGFISNKNDVLGKTDYQLFKKETADKFRENDLIVMEKKTEIQVEEINILNSGEKVMQLSTKRPLWNEEGDITGIVGVTIDITYLKKIEEDLVLAKQKAEEANQAKSEFIANMSHDIRTPLTGIIGMAQMLEQQVQDPQHKKYAVWLKDSGNNLLELLNSVLDVASVGKIDEEKLITKTFDLRKRINKVGKLELPTIKVKGLDLKIEIDEKLPQCVVSDEMKLHRILLNLLGNAIKFTEHGYVGISAKVLEQDKQQVIIEFKVFDSGIGIPEESQAKVFDRFFRLSPSYKGIYRGHGVGLHIVQQFVKRLGGKVNLTSQPGQGTTFSFILPFIIGKVEDLVIDEYDVQGESEVAQPQTNTLSVTLPVTNAVLSVVNESLPHFLLVEDNGIALMLIEGTVKDAGCRFTSARDGQQALELAKTKNFDLILTDIGLPDISGIEVTEHIRAWEKEQNKSRIPIVALTGHAVGEAEKACLQAGIDKVLTKPANISTIKSLVKQFNLNYQSKVVMEETTSTLETKQVSSLGRDLPANEEELFRLNQFPLLDSANGIETLGSIEVLKEMLNILLTQSMPMEEVDIKAAYTKQDWQQVANLAHRMKSGAIYCGTIRLRYACQYLERYRKAGHQALQEQLYQQLLTVIDETKAKIEEWLKQNKN